MPARGMAVLPRKTDHYNQSTLISITKGRRKFICIATFSKCISENLVPIPKILNSCLIMSLNAHSFTVCILEFYLRLKIIK